jgi:hypothetical protein
MKPAKRQRADSKLTAGGAAHSRQLEEQAFLLSAAAAAEAAAAGTPAFEDMTVAEKQQWVTAGYALFQYNSNPRVTAAVRPGHPALRNPGFLSKFTRVDSVPVPVNCPSGQPASGANNEPVSREAAAPAPPAAAAQAFFQQPPAEQHQQREAPAQQQQEAPAPLQQPQLSWQQVVGQMEQLHAAVGQVSSLCPLLEHRGRVVLTAFDLLGVLQLPCMRPLLPWFNLPFCLA